MLRIQEEHRRRGLVERVSDLIPVLTAVDSSKENARLLGGFITNQLGRFPRAGESVEAAGARFTVETVEGKRIRRVRIRKPEPMAEPA